MKINLLTDAPKHNLALMKISAYHKACGDEVLLNSPVFPADYTYASVLFEWNKNKFIADEYGGPAYAGVMDRNGRDDRKTRPLIQEIESMRPDYGLYPTIECSFGYTYRPCSNGCGFCKVPFLCHPDYDHHSIFGFHDNSFNKICLLNNNTFQDPKWRETFEEIWDADLSVVDENGYDLRLLDEEKADALKRTKFVTKIHFAWDRMQDEALILHGLGIAQKYNLTGNRVYVLIGYDTTLEDDLYRCQRIIENKQDPYIMPYKRTRHTKAFKRFIDSFMWRKYKNLKQAWEKYR